MFENIKEKVAPYKTKIIMGASSLALAISPASAATGNLTDVGPIIEDAGTIMPSVLALVIAVAGVIIGMAVIRFVTGLFDNILSGMRFR